MKLIVGLGNPGEEYKNTRHNVGFMVIDALAGRLGLLDCKLEKKFAAEITKQDDVIFAKPQTFMNESGGSIRKITDFYKIDPQNVWVIYDDKDLAFGKIRIRTKGSSGGHKGLQSIIDHLNTENFTRFRIGTIAPNKKVKDTAKYVLKPFSRKQKRELEDVINKVVNAIKTALEKGIKKSTL